jgi:hypothetical protein
MVGAVHFSEFNFADVSLPDLDGALTDPLFWGTIAGPAIILAITALYFCWLSYKMKRLK